MTNKPVRYKKLKKLIRDPNLFFYDMFRKRVFKGAPPAALQKTAQTSLTTAKTIDLMEVNRTGLPAYIRKHLNTGQGAEDGRDPNSIVIWSGYITGLISFLADLKAAAPTDITIYTLGGGVNIVSPAAQKLDTASTSKALSSRPNFVVEISSPQGQLCVLHFYPYDIGPDGDATVRSNRAWVRRFAVQDFDRIFNKAADAECEKIDAVYTWVNHADTTWQSLWKESFPEQPFDPDRYTSNDELRYSLRSLNKYAPWLNRIHIVSNCSKPTWLVDDSRINWVTHEAIFPDKSALPTFNSHAIEACLHRIPGLTEKFIYLNDDFILSQPCLPVDFFDETGRSVTYFEPYGMVSGIPTAEAPDYLIAANNVRALLAKDFPHYNARTLHRHVPYCLKKSVMAEIESKYPSAFTKTRLSKLRSEQDVNITSFFYHHYAQLTGQAVKSDASGLIVRPNNISAIISKDAFKYKFLCFNDGNGSADDTNYKEMTKKFFELRLSHRAPWERTII
ncbi:Exopolysaccharide phosphotransferase [Pseudomonas sp. XWY-1]|uniref:stealth conserved region 3 domain-containing protein n=1 Tax=Pseudomonas TaxID=286 RepID=UPI000CDBDD06|nr:MULTISPECIES: stealth conserved region 3 domain-containing protein [Pseudomonas]AUZ60633.1 Exopolysaccharide phosphotransferase [Pseudomonas sp. XWY-1]EKT4568930.1 stealth conserved region 3 domain-containing protein [Pseudomonas putida]QUG91044.1 sugar phosphotransferase [Pseudomonas putida]